MVNNSWSGNAVKINEAFKNVWASFALGFIAPIKHSANHNEVIINA
ncbi:hypothetical protein [Mucilaginibacter sp. OK098]|nr:hypothetical protein [Mucilaginibacter sp. OK098]